MIDLFDTLSQAVAGQFGFALVASFTWGVLSIILSPCHLTSIPLVLGYISKQNEASGRRSALLALTFSIGILASIAVIGIITASMGRLMGDVGVWGIWLTAMLLIVFGLYLMDIISLNWLGGRMPKIERAGHGGAMLLGLVFGIGLGPCTLAFLAPILASVYNIANESMMKAVLMISAFGMGHTAVIVVGGSMSTVIIRFTKWTEDKATPVYVRRVLGLLVVVGGIYYLYNLYR